MEGILEEVDSFSTGFIGICPVGFLMVEKLVLLKEICVLAVLVVDLGILVDVMNYYLQMLHKMVGFVAVAFESYLRKVQMWSV